MKWDRHFGRCSDTKGKEGEDIVIIREATEADVMQIAGIIVEDWQKAYRGIVDDDYLDSMTVEEQYRKEIRRYREYTVAAEGDEVLGAAWNRMTDEEAADCEIVALYVRYSERKRGIGGALLRDSADRFRKAGKKTMIIWCLAENLESRRFYEKMGGKAWKNAGHNWGGREYDMASYLYRLDG